MYFKMIVIDKLGAIQSFCLVCSLFIFVEGRFIICADDRTNTLWEAERVRVENLREKTKYSIITSHYFTSKGYSVAV